MDGEDSSLEVLIVGAGPVDLALSLLLTKLGIKCAIVEKGKTFSRHPRAHVILNRTMEVFRKMDGMGDDILRLQPPVNSWRNFAYFDNSLTGPILGLVDHIKPQDFDQILSPVTIANYSQYKVQDLLLEKLKNLGFQIENSETLNAKGKKYQGLNLNRKILMGHECKSIKTSHHGVIATICFDDDKNNNKQMEKEIHCEFIVGADGARSTIQKLLGTEMVEVGQLELKKFVSAHFFSKKLGDYLMKVRPGIMFFIYKQDVHFLAAHDLRIGEFALQVPESPQQKLEDFSLQEWERLITGIVGRELEDLQIKTIKPWVAQAQIAEKFTSCENRVLLVGDAAHRFPPAGAFGMNTGIQDAHNLAWKLACVVKGMAPVSFLSTYDLERRQIANYNTALSIENLKIPMRILAAHLGIDPISRLAELKQIFERGESLQLQYPAEDLGLRYLEGALVCDDDDNKAIEPPSGRWREYVPSTDPGSKLPHMHVRPLSTKSTKATISTLDLISSNKLEFILIIAPIKESYNLAQALFKVAEKIKVPLKACVMWPENTNSNGEISTSVEELKPWKNFIDVVEVKRSKNSSSWWNLCKISNRGVILVRPDEHVAWRSKSGNINDPISEMRRVFSTIFGLEGAI